MRISLSPEVFKAVSVTEWDDDAGVLSTTGDLIRHEVQVRARLQDALLRQAVILELERQGYTVLSPEE